MSSAVNALEVLEAVGAHQPVGVGQLARAIGKPKSTIQRALMVLHAEGWIRPNESEMTRWVLTAKVMLVAGHVADDLGIRSAATPIMQRLRDQTGETIHLTLPEANGTVLIERLDSPQTVRTASPLGSSGPLHATSNGKAVLAFLPSEEIDEAIRQGLDDFTGRTICDADGLRDELASIRARGYSTNFEEWQIGTASVGAPVLDNNRRPVAAMSISAPSQRLESQELRESYGNLVKDAAAELSSVLGFG